MCADWSLHDKGDGNPHAHIMLTTRPIEPNGKWGVKERKGYALDEQGQRIPLIDETTGKQKVDKRNRKQWKRAYIQVNDWNDTSNAEKWRQSWAEVCNGRLQKDNQIDHRSFERRGIALEPTIHEGYVARKMERKGTSSDRCQINRDIKTRNVELMAVSDELNSIIKAEEALSLIDSLLVARDEYYRQAIAIDVLNRTPNVRSFRVTSNAMKQAIKDLPKKVGVLKKLDKQLENYSTQKFGGLINTLFHSSEKDELEKKRSNALKDCKRTLKIFTDGGVNTFIGDKEVTYSKLSKRDVDGLIRRANDIALPSLEYWEAFHQLTKGVSPESLRQALEQVQELYKAIPQDYVDTAIQLLESEPIPIYSINKTFNISRDSYSKIENTINSTIGVCIKPIEPTGISTKLLFSLDDLKRSEYAPRSNQMERTQDKKKDASLE